MHTRQGTVSVHSLSVPMGSVCPGALSVMVTVIAGMGATKHTAVSKVSLFGVFGV